MLTLMRRIGQSIYIGENREIEIKLINMTGDGSQASIGIHAPRHIPIVRDDVKTDKNKRPIERFESFSENNGNVA